MKKQRIFDVVWSGVVSNNWNHDSIVADSIADAEKRAKEHIFGLKLIKSITDSHNDVWAEVKANDGSDGRDWSHNFANIHHKRE